MGPWQLLKVVWDPFKKWGVALAKERSEGFILEPSGPPWGQGQATASRLKRRLQTCPGTYWLRWATLRGLDWTEGWRGRGLTASALLGC